MTLEELFRVQRAPKDYVTYPPQETPNLEKFLAERSPKPTPKASMFGKDFLNSPDEAKKASAPIETPAAKEVVAPITPELKAVADVSPKVDPERLAEIRAKLRMEPESVAQMPEQQMQQPQTQQYPSPVAASDLIDVRKVQRQAEELAPRATNTDLAMV